MSILCKNAIFQNAFSPWVPACSDPNILSPTPNIKIRLPNFTPSSQGSKKVCCIPVGQKLREEKDFEEAGCFGPRPHPRDQLTWQPWPEMNCKRDWLVLKILARSFHSIRSFSTFSLWQTHRHKPSYLYKNGLNFCMPFFTSLCSWRIIIFVRIQFCFSS